MVYGLSLVTPREACCGKAALVQVVKTTALASPETVEQ